MLTLTTPNTRRSARQYACQVSLSRRQARSRLNLAKNKLRANKPYVLAKPA